jgi:glycosyltransferase involved in cell wall biosynthesis
LSAGALSVVHVSATDNEGGSGRAAYRIHEGLRALGTRSRMIVGLKVTQDPDVHATRGGIGLRVDLRADRLLSRLGRQYQFVPSALGLARHPWFAEADVVQLYNLHGGYFPTGQLAAIGARAPVVWRLSDMWPLTGHCAYSGSCERWRTGCGSCPDLATYPGIGRDTTAELWRQKQALYAGCRLTFVAPSSWTEALAKASPLSAHSRVVRIPNGIDTETFRADAGTRAAARARFGIAPSAKTILFVAHGLDANPRKGGDHLIEALRRLPRPEEVTLLLAGVGGESWRGRVGAPVRTLGYLRDNAALAAAYAAADLVAAPSIVENLPNTVLEAMSCGTPAVAYDTGGMRDAVQHMATGYLARHGDAGDLAHGLDALLGDDALRMRLGTAARSYIESEHTLALQARRFLDLYQEIRREARA